MKIIVIAASLVFATLATAQGTSTQIHHVKGDRDRYTGIVGNKQVQVLTKSCLHKAEDEQAGYYDLDVPGAQSIVFANSDTCKVTSFGEMR